MDEDWSWKLSWNSDDSYMLTDPTPPTPLHRCRLNQPLMHEHRKLLVNVKEREQIKEKSHYYR